jgi:hypothetical protein
MTTPLFISYSNHGYVEIAENLVKSAQRLRHHRLRMYCLDKETFEHLLPYQEQTPMTIELKLYDHHHTSKLYERYNSEKFKQIDHIHFSVIRDALNEYSFVHFLDSDTTIIDEPPADFYDTYQEQDVVFQCDHPVTEPNYHIWSCIGNMSMRNTPGTFFLLDAIEIYKSHIPHMNDQEILMEIFKGADIEDIRKYPHARCTQYPPTQFTSGILVINDIVDKSQIYIFHANYVIGKEAKIELLKKAGGWYLPI